MRHRYKMTIEYDGSLFAGWQRLRDNDNTVQNIIEEAVTKAISSKKRIKINGSGRTDAGVHALAQTADFACDIYMECDELKRNINDNIKKGIQILEVEKVDMDYHSRYSATEKEYVYLIWNGEVRNVFKRKYSYHVEEKLDIEKMKQAAKRLVGRKDYRAVSSVKDEEKDTVRTIRSIDIIKEGDMIRIHYVGDGFLYNMVRILTGTIIEVGLGRIKSENIDRIIDSGKRENAGFTAPAQGLYLAEVRY